MMRATATSDHAQTVMSPTRQLPIMWATHLQVVREQVGPLGCPGGEAVLEGLGADLDEPNNSAARQASDLLPDCPAGRT